MITLSEFQNRVLGAVYRANQAGLRPTSEELADELGVSKDEVDQAMSVLQSVDFIERALPSQDRGAKP